MRNIGSVIGPDEVRVPSRLRRFVTFTTILLALLSGAAASPAHAQEEEHPPIYAWAETDTVELSTSMSATAGMRSLNLTIPEGASATYYIRLSEQPTASGWWVRVHVDGTVRYDGEYDADRDGESDISWVPSVGWEFQTDNSENPTRWRSVTINALEDDDTDDELVNFTHEVWDEESNCPPSLHGIAPITVRIIDNDVASTSVQLQVNPPAVAEDASPTQVASDGGVERLGAGAGHRRVGRGGKPDGRLRAGGSFHDHNTGAADERDGEVSVRAGGRRVGGGRRDGGRYRHREWTVGDPGNADDRRQRHR